MTVRDRLQRRAIPRAVVALSTVRAPGRATAALRRAAGRQATVRLYVAFDDAYSAVALLGLRHRLTSRRVRLHVEPVVERGIPGDPAAADKRAHAVMDSRRLARRAGAELSRTEPLSSADTAFLADWAAAAPPGRRAAFCVAAMEQLWFRSAGPVEREPYAALWREHVGGSPPSASADARPAERGFRRRRLYDTPVAVVHGQWFFAHERLPQIEHRLDELGWGTSEAGRLSGPQDAGPDAPRS